jgi:spore germination protein YaaH
VNSYGHLVGVPKRNKLNKFRGRVHVSLTCGSYGLTHFVIEPGSRARAKFYAELVAMARDYDGLNIDLEYVPLQDAANFNALLRELKAALGNKVLSVCVPARTKENQTYNYVALSAIVDKVFVMAYDEHWATSAPGPVASMNWCKTVAAYSLKTIGADKLVMGLPFYGRSWANKSTARGLIASTTERIMDENNVTSVERVNGVPTFKYDVNVTVTVYFDDAYSLSTRMEMYREMGVDKIGFWRMGQEDPAVWDFIKIKSGE